MNDFNDTILEINDLHTHFFLDEGILKAVDGVSFSVHRGKSVGVIGESGCGKSVTAQSVLQIVPSPGKIVGGEIFFRPRSGASVDLVSLDPVGTAIRDIRGREIAMVFQEPMTSLSPVHTIGNQIDEVILLHRTNDKREARELTVEMLEKVGIPNPRECAQSYTYQLSGGLRQRAMIAMALSCSPSLLIADEPTTALDVTVQAQILDLISQLQEQYSMAMLYITHDLGVIAEVAEEVVVMYLGLEVEYAPVRELFHHPLHPYTELLLKSIPKIGKKARTTLEAIKGTVPMPIDLPDECPFLSRCPKAMKGICNRGVPPLIDAGGGHRVRCRLYGGEV